MKKFFLLLAALVSLSACSSNQKKEAMESDQAQTMSKEADAQKETMTEQKEMADNKAMGSKSTCTLDKDTRIIEVKKTDTGGCELFYTKFGEAKSVASSGFGTQYCEEVKDRIQTNLNKAGFTCQ
jgi:uncharacterized protein YceK